ncbi:DUF3139 domain-containing protein [Shimazuella kribbensis]|uniref:DUF3139 domain-containing protein n=1 Tax=Shimazuella kribbensis TaxID=139808 RepID=UPI0003FD57F8|nr:DUF3139 domain-containing protein [Shimazuella kribbensis]
MKIIKWVLCILLILVVVAIGLFYLIFLKPETEMKNKQTNKVKLLLLQKGIKESDITTIKTGKMEGSYYTFVVFKDEPKAGYVYREYGASYELVQDCDYYDQSGEQITSRREKLFQGMLLNGRPEGKHREKYCPSDRQIIAWMIQKGYKKSDINIFSSNYPLKNSGYEAILDIQFRDEKEVSYLFVKEEKSEKVIQICGYSDMNGKWFTNRKKHSEKTCIKNKPGRL